MVFFLEVLNVLADDALSVCDLDLGKDVLSDFDLDLEVLDVFACFVLDDDLLRLRLCFSLCE